ncbi:response regulator [Legionella sp. W05-934-2]|jgi:CheY-like chemotaxis protein|uniref:response regulator n=1 Tax=Legionella sp. W05-934-2 TaxID=1198649 RepID=UPI003461DB2B
MNILIVDDNAFGAYCLSRLLSLVNADVSISIVHNSQAALSAIETRQPDWVVLDGDLQAGDGIYCNGPALLDCIWSVYPDISAVVWTDSDAMRLKFAEVFDRYNKPFTEDYCWPKMVKQNRIRRLFQIHQNAFAPGHSDWYSVKHAQE